jgi:hypothetical protein
MNTIKLKLLAALTWLLALPAMLALEWRIRRRKQEIAHGVNIAEGVHKDSITKLSAAAITARHLLYKQGADVNHVAVSGASDQPLGVVADEATAAEENIAVLLLGKGPTKRMVASEAITAGVAVYAAASGKIATTGTILVGVSLTAADADDDVIEVLDFPNGTASPGIAASIFDAHTMLYATTDNTPAALTIAASRIPGRAASGNIVALTGAQVKAITDPITMEETAVAADDLVVPVTHRSVDKTTGADAEALSLADGAFLGQRLSINLVVDGGGDGTLTPTTPSGFATIVFADAGDSVDLEWTTDGWRIVGAFGLTAQPVITA